MAQGSACRRAFVLLAGTLALAACVQSPPARPSGGLAGSSALGGGVVPFAPGAAGQPAPPGKAVALLAPLTGPNAERGQTLVNAAKLALAAPGSPALDVRDTGGTADGAAAAAQQAIAAGAGLVIGPLTAAETAGAARIAKPAGVAVLAFTNDPAQAQPGVWTLGITPSQQVRRLVGAALSQGKSRFAALLPESDFGNAMRNALTQATSSGGAPPPDIRTYSSGSMSGAVRDIAAYGSRMGPLMAQLRAARQQRDEAGRQRAAELSRADARPPDYDMLLLAEAGPRLATLTELLTSYEVHPPAVRFLGPALWADPTSRGGASLDGAWYAAPDPAARTGFAQQYQTAYGSPAPGLADVAYDAASIARVVAPTGGFAFGALTQPDGFAGVDGVFALQPDGTVRRGLALFTLDHGAAQMVEPAPTTLSAPAS